MYGDKNITLKECLEKYHDRNVKIGSATGYMYCGIADIETVLHVSELERNKVLDRVHDCIDKIIRLDEMCEREIGSRVGAVVREMRHLPYEEDNKVGIAARKAAISAVHSQFEARHNDVEKLRDNMAKLSPWVALLDREVIEVWDSFDEPGTKNIKIEGDENGKYWTTHEYESGIVPEDEED